MLIQRKRVGVPPFQKGGQGDFYCRRLPCLSEPSFDSFCLYPEVPLKMELSSSEAIIYMLRRIG